MGFQPMSHRQDADATTNCPYVIGIHEKRPGGGLAWLML
jgi:hypothetical protein